VTRGVLVDMARARSKPMLEEGEVITADDLRARCATRASRCGRAMSSSSIPLGRAAGARPGTVRQGRAGDRQWRGGVLASLGVVAWGRIPGGGGGAFKNRPRREGHQTLLAKNGIHSSVMDTRALAREGEGIPLVLGQPLLRGACSDHQPDRHPLEQIAEAGTARGVKQCDKTCAWTMIRESQRSRNHGPGSLSHLPRPARPADAERDDAEGQQHQAEPGGACPVLDQVETGPPAVAGGGQPPVQIAVPRAEKP
jgi:hypothetical protein